MRTISVQQPYASLICAGIKDVDNRTWSTEYRGPLAIHASGDEWAWPDASYLPTTMLERCRPWIGVEDLTGLPPDLLRYHELIVRTCAHYGRAYSAEIDRLSVEEMRRWLRAAVREYGYALPARAIVGEVELVDVVRDSASVWAAPGHYHLIFAQPILYCRPVRGVSGRLRLFDVDFQRPE